MPDAADPRTDAADDDVAEEAVTIPAPGATLAGTLFRAADPRARAVIHPATGTPQGFYRAFARWLAAARRVTALTYDPRHFGRSPGGPARASNSTMTDWGVRDQQAARDWLSEQGDGPLWVIGHSLGGMMLPFQAGLERIDRVIAVASGTVHVTDHPWPYRLAAASFWWGHGAAAHAALGYLPGRLVGLGPADVPSGVFRQWRRWCTTRGFHAGDPLLPPADASALTAPFRMVAVADDAMCPPAAAWRLLALHGAARGERVLLRPDRGPIGHHGAFRRRGAHLWPAIVD